MVILINLPDQSNSRKPDIYHVFEFSEKNKTSQFIKDHKKSVMHVSFKLATTPIKKLKRHHQLLTISVF